MCWARRGPSHPPTPHPPSPQPLPVCKAPHGFICIKYVFADWPDRGIAMWWHISFLICEVGMSRGLAGMICNLYFNTCRLIRGIKATNHLPCAGVPTPPPTSLPLHCCCVAHFLPLMFSQCWIGQHHWCCCDDKYMFAVTGLFLVLFLGSKMSRNLLC